MMRTFLEAVVAIGASVEMLVVLKATIALALGLTAVRIARSGRASVRHLLLISTFGTLVALPIAMTVVPVVRLEIPTKVMISSIASPAIARDRAIPTTRASRIDALPVMSGEWISKSGQTLLEAVWAIGAAMFLATFANALWQLRRLRRSGVPWLEAHATLRVLADESGVHRSAVVLLHDAIVAPVTCGLLHPAILMPADAREWSEPEVRRALVHELEHIRRGDWTLHILAHLICAFYWFHPLVWIAWRQLCLEAERACDDAVLQGAERTDYAEQLVVLAGRLSNAVARPALSMANRSDLSTRVSAILDIRQSRGSVGRLPIAAALTAAVVVVLAIAPVRTVATSSGGKALVSLQKPAAKGSKQLNSALLEAAGGGDVGEITKLLDAGADVNATFNGDGSPLIVASREGHIAAVQLLLDRGADADMGVPGDGNAIIMAAREGHEDVVKLLLDRGASIDRVVAGDENALIQASGEGHLNVLKLLISRGADINARVWAARDRDGSNGEWRTPLAMARKRGNKEVVDFLLSIGARE